jgi:hypothetical protein
MKSIRVACLAMLFGSTLVLAQSNPVPLINNPLVPASTAPGGGDFTLTVNGTGFAPGSSVNWNGTPLDTKFVSGSQLTATVPAADIAKPGTASVSVVNSAPGGGTSNVDFFAVRQPFTAVSFGLSSVIAAYFPTSITTADLNGDGKLDLITSDDGAVSVFFGNGDGTFQIPVDYPLNGFAGQVVTGDFNGDGPLDLVVQTVDGFSLLLGNGNGTFQPAQDFLISGGPGLLVAGDFNSDGKLDLAMTLSAGQVGIVLGNGDGTFQNLVDYTAGSGTLYSIAAGDFNGDNRLDLAVVVNADNAVSILLGNGDGSFQNAVEYATALGPAWLSAVDLDGDGKLDLAVNVIASTPPAISVLLGNGDGTFQGHVDFPTLQETFTLAAADLNGDDEQDLVVTNFFRSTIDTFLGQGNGQLQQPNIFPAGTNTNSLAVGDFNGDGMLDLATTPGNGSAEVSVLLQVTSVLSKTIVKFGSVQVGKSSPPVMVKFSNIGATSLTIQRIALLGGGARQFAEKNDCSHSLAPGASCAITVVFRPQSVGTFSAKVKINDSADNQPQTITLQGTGIQ